MRIANLFLLAFVTWTMLFWYHYVHNIKGLCVVPSAPTVEVPTTEPAIAIPETNKQLVFKLNAYTPIIKGISPEGLIDSIMSKGLEGQLLQITGFATSNEQAGLDFNLAESRALEFKKLFQEQLPDDRIEIFAETINQFTFYKDSLIDAVYYEWVDGYVPDQPLNYYVLDHDTKRVNPKQFDELLTQIAERLKATDGILIIRGHTDATGEKETNFKIALRNAKHIRDALKKKGLSRKKIKTTAQGEESPIADNATKEGKRANRRVELEIIVKQ